MADWGASDKVVGGDDWGKADAVVTAPAKKGAPPKTPPPEEPGWFMPGSKSEAALRGFSQGATLGFGDEIQALIRSVGSDRTYAQLRDEERAANNAAAAQNTGSYMVGNIAGALPSAAASVGAIPGKLGLAKAGEVAGKLNSPARVIMGQAASKASTAAKGGAIVGGVAGLGSGEGDVGSQLTSTAVGAGTGAVLNGALAKVGRGTTAAVQAAKTAVADPGKETAIGALIGAGGALATGQDPITGAIIGGAGGRAGLNSVVRGVIKATPAKVGTVASRAIPLSQATSQALVNMTNQQTRAATTAGNDKIRAAVEAGKPAYAATFSELQSNPAYRTATMKEADAGSDPFDDENDDE